MHYVSHGQGEPVVLIHGLFGNLDNLKNLAVSLESSFTLYRVDVANHGQSQHVDKMDYISLANDCIALLDSLNIKQAHFVGHSMGGKIAMAVALLHPHRVSSLVVADIAPVAYQPRHQSVFNALTSLPLTQITGRMDAFKHLQQSGIDDGTAQFLLKNLQRETHGFSWKMNLTGIINAYSDIIHWPFTAAGNDHLSWQPYKKPCLFIRGGDSDYVTSEHRDSIMKQFPAVTAKTLNGTGHWLHAQKPEIFNRLVGQFLEQNSIK